MKKNAALDKQQLYDLGIRDILKDANGEWVLLRLAYPVGPRTTQKPHLTMTRYTDAVCKHKYTKDKVYRKFTFCGKSFTVSRVVYAWYKGAIPSGYEVDHIDNDPFNNDLDNLRLATPEENLKKRYKDWHRWDTPNQYNRWRDEQ